MKSSISGLGNQAILNKIDQPRELKVNSIMPPQIVLLGDQSSGKSSVLESLTGFSFLQASGLCTRYATQIFCRREREQHVAVSIIPRQDADAATENRLREFKRNIPKLTNEAIVQISIDVLQIEICAPEQEQLTVIDVPGIFRVPSPPFTTDHDVD
ncbi:hypothetical protein EJ02DRAFT_479837 [Clathrospora elynae]|uniref:Dynamin N-terminal domain-containing protein n=1 Tax=Clathrospora elynae TaxID=706981 RepID=A0A6A5SAS2_9PLEO|nr:hypothetical protein EJ02DRAFT_479837 [Clathrospora elynae]